jgi:hypothetical protein
MDGFDHILNWMLKKGSHPFPGKDGGTCIGATDHPNQPVQSAPGAMPGGSLARSSPPTLANFTA